VICTLRAHVAEASYLCLLCLSLLDRLLLSPVGPPTVGVMMDAWQKRRSVTDICSEIWKAVL
jgi:hypothetical protein